MEEENKDQNLEQNLDDEDSIRFEDPWNMNPLSCINPSSWKNIPEWL